MVWLQQRQGPIADPRVQARGSSLCLALLSETSCGTTASPAVRQDTDQPCIGPARRTQRHWGLMSINNPQVLAWCHRSTDVHADNNVKPLRTVLCSEYGKCDPASTRKQTQVQGRNNKKAEMLANKVSNIAYTTLRNCKAIPLAILSRWSLHFRRQHYLGIHIIS